MHAPISLVFGIALGTIFQYVCLAVIFNAPISFFGLDAPISSFGGAGGSTAAAGGDGASMATGPAAGAGASMATAGGGGASTATGPAAGAGSSTATRPVALIVNTPHFDTRRDGPKDRGKPLVVGNLSAVTDQQDVRKQDDQAFESQMALHIIYLSFLLRWKRSITAGFV